MSKSLGLCLDLNIWCAALLADAKGRQQTASQSLIDIVRRGWLEQRRVELIISWGMLNRLQQVLETQPKLQVFSDDAKNYIEVIRRYAQLSPQLTLGGTGVIPLFDDEDRHVLETALAGRASLLITANFKDFLVKDVDFILPNQHAIYRSPIHSFHIVHPYLAIRWLNEGLIPLID